MNQAAKKKKLALYTATGCRACEHAILDLNYEVNALSRWAEIAFWPYVLGSSWENLQGDEPVDVCFFAGAIRTMDDRQAAIKLRDKSRIMVATGACAAFGGLPGLVNLAAPTAENPETEVPKEGVPTLTRTESLVSGLPQVVRTDYFVPGCPPTQNLLWAAFQALVCQGESPARLSYAAARLPDVMAQAVTAGVLPPQGSTFGGEKAVCASCSRIKEEKRFEAYKRPYQEYEETGRCLLEQGLICQGVATREGCGGLCTGVGLPCRGCFGKAEAIFDPGAKMVSAISSTFDFTDAEAIARLVNEFVDLAGTFYRYVLPTQCALRSAPSTVKNDEDRNL